VKRALGLLLVGILVLTFGSVVALAQTGNGHAEPPNTGGVFTDVARDHWAYEDLEYLQSRGIITGLPGGAFQGDQFLSRYDAAAMIARAIKYLQNNPESVTLEDLDVLKNLIFQVNDDLIARVESQMGTSQGSDVSTLMTRVSQNELGIADLNTQIQDLSGSSSSSLARRVQANFFISLTALLIGIVGVALATLGL